MSPLTSFLMICDWKEEPGWVTDRLARGSVPELLLGVARSLHQSEVRTVVT